MYIKLSLVIFLLALIRQYQSYTFMIGNCFIIPKDFHIISVQDTCTGVNISKQDKYQSRLKMFIFPYNIYEYRQKKSQSNNYLFVKINYEIYKSSIFDHLERNYKDIDQYKQLYSIIPSVAIYKSQDKQYLQLISIEQSFIKRYFAIKNMTKNHSNNNTDHFYDIQVIKIDTHFFFSSIIKHIQLQNTFSLQFFNNIGKKKNISYQLFNNNQTYKKQSILRSYFGDQNNIIQYQSNNSHLFSSQFKHKIHKYTKLQIKSNSFNVYFAYSHIMIDSNITEPSYNHQSKNTVLNQQDQKSQTNLQIHLLIYSNKKMHKINYFSQSLQNLNLTTLKYFQLNFNQKQTTIFISDGLIYYIIDVSQSKWRINTYKILNKQTSNLFLSQLKGPISIQNNTVNVYTPYFRNGFKQQYQSQIIWNKDISLQRYILCFSENNCSLYFKNSLKQIVKINLTLSSIKDNIIQQKSSLQDNNMTLSFVIIDHSSLNQLFNYRLQSTLIIFDYKNRSKSIFQNQIYNYDAYYNMKQLKQKQMNKMIYEYFNKINYNYQNDYIQNPLKKHKSLKNYYQFLQYIQSQLNKSVNNSCYTIQFPNNNTQIYNLSASSQKVCAFTYTSPSFIRFQIQYKNYFDRYKEQIYICRDDQNSTNSNVICTIYKYKNQEKEDDEDKGYKDAQYLLKNKFYKFYVIKINEGENLPVFQFTDIQKQFYQLGQSIFYIIIMGLSLFIIFVICFLIMRPIIHTLSIYYGFRNQVVQPQYPLNWINLKIKIKKLQKMNYLKYVQFHFKDGQTEDDDHDCCFCLQSLKKGSKVAQLYCLHSFHADCFNQWIRNQPNNRCPKCRRSFTQIQLLQFQNNMHGEQIAN